MALLPHFHFRCLYLPLLFSPPPYLPPPLLLVVVGLVRWWMGGTDTTHLPLLPPPPPTTRHCATLVDGQWDWTEPPTYPQPVCIFFLYFTVFRGGFLCLPPCQLPHSLHTTPTQEDRHDLPTTPHSSTTFPAPDTAPTTHPIPTRLPALPKLPSRACTCICTAHSISFCITTTGFLLVLLLTFPLMDVVLHGVSPARTCYRFCCYTSTLPVHTHCHQAVPYFYWHLHITPFFKGQQNISDYLPPATIRFPFLPPPPAGIHPSTAQTFLPPTLWFNLPTHVRCTCILPTTYLPAIPYSYLGPPSTHLPSFLLLFLLCYSLHIFISHG